MSEDKNESFAEKVIRVKTTAIEMLKPRPCPEPDCVDGLVKRYKKEPSGMVLGWFPCPVCAEKGEDDERTKKND